MSEYENFVGKYKLIKNSFTNAAFDGFMFETYGKEIDFVKSQPNNKVWTILESDGAMTVDAGFHYVNRLGYFVSENEWSDPNESYEIDTEIDTEADIEED